jgi:hypothetical protein
MLDSAIKILLKCKSIRERNFQKTNKSLQRFFLVFLQFSHISLFSQNFCNYRFHPTQKNLGKQTHNVIGQDAFTLVVSVFFIRGC